jgi:dihydroorotase-like cyclic amidohydrolase
MSLLNKNGEIVTASERYNADIYCEAKTITRIDCDFSAPVGTPLLTLKGNSSFLDSLISRSWEHARIRMRPEARRRL